MPRPMTDRMSAIEEQLRVLRENERTITRSVRGINRRLAGMDEDDAQGRVGPGSLHQFVGPHRAHRTGQAPDMGQAGLQRLMDDPMIGASIAGLTTPFAGTGNMLLDPTFERNVFASVTIGTAYTSIGWRSFWEAKYATTSGVAASSRNIESQPDKRVEPSSGAGYTSSALMQPVILWSSGAGATGTTTMTIRNRAVSAYTPFGYPEAAFVVGACRVVGVDLFGGGVLPEAATAWIEIVDQSDNILATGDTLDLLSVEQDRTIPSIHAALEDPEMDGSILYSVRIVIEVVSGTRAGNVGIIVTLAEPLLAPSDEGSPQSFQPAIGAWVPSHYSPTIGYIELTGSANDWVPPSNGQVIVIDPDGAYTITGMEAPTQPWQYHRWIYNLDTTNDVTLAHASVSSSASNRFYLPNGASLVIRDGGGVELLYFGVSDGTLLRWRVLSEV